MKKAISYSSDFMRSIDLDNATYEKQGLKLLDSVNPDSDYKLNATNNPQPVVNSTDKSNNNYNDLLK